MGGEAQRFAVGCWVKYTTATTTVITTTTTSRPDITFAVDWVLNNNYLSIYYHYIWMVERFAVRCRVKYTTATTTDR